MNETAEVAACSGCGRPRDKNRLCECGAGWLTPTVKTVVILLCLPVEVFGELMHSMDFRYSQEVCRAVFDVAGFFPPWTDALRLGVLQEFLGDRQPDLAQCLESILGRFREHPQESLDRLAALWGPVQLPPAARQALQLHRLHSPYWTRLKAE